MKIWHDDVRSAPAAWTWAHTNADAKRMLASYNVDEISLDHDLGETGETGLDLVRWMIENGLVPPRVTIHSWNPAGAQRMAHALVDAGLDAPLVAPFQISEHV